MSRIYSGRSGLGEGLEAFGEGQERQFQRELKKRQQKQSEARDRAGAEEWSFKKYKKARVKDGLVDGYDSDTESRERDIPILRKKDPSFFRDEEAGPVRQFEDIPGKAPAEENSLDAPTNTVEAVKADPLNAWMQAEFKRRQAAGNPKLPTAEEFKAATMQGPAPVAQAPAQPVKPLLETPEQTQAKAAGEVAVTGLANKGPVDASLLEGEAAELGAPQKIGSRVDPVTGATIDRFAQVANKTSQSFDEMPVEGSAKPAAPAAPQLDPNVALEQAAAAKDPSEYDPSDALLSMIAEYSTTAKAKDTDRDVLIGTLPEDLQRVVLGKGPGDPITAAEQRIAIPRTTMEKVLEKRLGAKAGFSSIRPEVAATAQAVLDGTSTMADFAARHPDASKDEWGIFNKAFGAGQKNQSENAREDRKNVDPKVYPLIDEVREGNIPVGTAMRLAAQAKGSALTENERFEIRNAGGAKDREENANAIKPTRTTLTPNELMKVDLGKSAFDTLRGLDQVIRDNAAKFGPVKGRVGGWNGYDEQAQALQSTFKSAMQAGGSFLEGGVLRKEDEIKYKDMFPNLSDTPETALSKYQSVLRLLARKAKSQRDTLEKAGYDVSPFDQIVIPELPDSITGGNTKKGGIGAAVTGVLGEVPDAISGGSRKTPSGAPAPEGYEQELNKAKGLMGQYRRKIQEEMERGSKGAAWASKQIEARKQAVDEHLKAKYGKGFNE